MAINIGKFLKPEAYDSINTAIGKLSIFNASVGNLIELSKDLGKPISECEPDEFVRNLAIYICYPASELREEKYKPDNPVLSKDRVNSLTNDDIEKIASVYVKNNEYLFKELQFKKRKNDKGEIVSHAEYGNIRYPKDEGESYTKYLHRLSVNKESDGRKRMAKMVGSISGLANFSNKLGDSIKNTLSWGDSLKKTMEGLRPFHGISIKPIEQPVTHIDFTEILRKDEDRRLKPFNNLAERLDQLVDISAQSIEFMVETNEIQTSIAGEIKASGDATAKFSKKNIFLSIIVILLTAFSIIISIHTTNNDKNSKVDQEELLHLLKESTNKQNEQLEKLVDKQTQIIKELKSIRTQENNRIKDIENKIIGMEREARPQ